MSNFNKWFTAEKISEILNITPRSVRRKAQDEDWPFSWDRNKDGYRCKLYKLPNSIDVSGVEDESSDQEEPKFFYMSGSHQDGMTDEEYLEEYIKKSNRKLKESDSTRDIIINDDKPIGISFISDQHLGDHAWVEKMVEDANIINETDGLYAMLGGDGWDNYIKHYSALVNKGSRAVDEAAAFRAYLKLFKDKILHIISGNHEGWTQAFSSIDPVKDIAHQMGISYSPNWKGVLRLHFLEDVNKNESGDIIIENEGSEETTVSYTVLMQHKSSWESRLNPEHACRATLERGDIDADIVCICHKHRHALFSFYVHGNLRYGVRPGTYKLTDPHGIKHGYVPDPSTCPTIIIYPGNNKKMVGFGDIKDAVLFLKQVRE